MVGKRTIMHWYSTSDRLPENKQEVLIYCHGQFNIAVYDQYAGGFTLKGGAFFHVDQWMINWARLAEVGNQIAQTDDK